ncbi:hypothetical protein [Paenibacillus sp. OV219]|uniref:hypothetical protein n=1 Tax=Paenibacillus sp. OV219 TaxID=1884377 RepID=UPI0008B28FBE|nr:hypothetical protein [Paenibacillus sp. OV219]SEM90766.1 hypothetical protein SAMN05518847_1011114 [Paenibacillus sp. OV219]
MTFALTDWMQYSMWVVLGMMGLNFLLGLYKGLMAGSMTSDMFTMYLKDMMYYVLPLFLMANMDASFDSSGWIMLTAYYVGAFGVVFKYFMDLKNKL